MTDAKIAAHNKARDASNTAYVAYNDACRRCIRRDIYAAHPEVAKAYAEYVDAKEKEVAAFNAIYFAH